MKKKLLVVMLTAALFANQFSDSIYATEVEDETNFNATVTVEFSEADAKAYQESIQKTLDESIEALENEILLSHNKEKINLLEQYQEEMENYDIEELFEVSSDGNMTMEIPYESLKLDIHGIETETDKNGESTIDNIDIDDIEAEDISVENINDEVDYVIDVDKKNNVINCDITMSFSDFSKGVETMSDNMTDAKAQSTKCNFFSKRKVGNSFGHGAGKSYIYFDKNIVGCNKCDKSEAKSYTTNEFALGNSDCSKSVKLGLIALTNTILSSYYSYSIYCVQEGMASVVSSDNESNAYCNHKKKSGGHVNCSWFNGIGHSEQFHTHTYS